MIIRESVRKMEDIKYFTKQILIEYNNAAIREKRNRAIEEQKSSNRRTVFRKFTRGSSISNCF